MTISSFSYSNYLKHKILLQADYPDPAETLSDLNPNVPSTAPTPPRADLATTVTDDGSQDPTSIRDWASIQTPPLYR